MPLLPTWSVNDVSASPPSSRQHSADANDSSSDGDTETLLLPSREVTRNDTSASVMLPKSLTVRLYTSHFLSTWNSRSFEFGAVLFLAEIYPNTLLPVSIYALVRGAAAIVFSSAVGVWIDNGNRLAVVRTSIIGQRLAVAASCAIFFALIRWKEDVDGIIGGVLFGIILLLASVEKLCSVMNVVSVERDWLAVITEGNEASRRALNSQIRRIDLSCKLLGPLLVALIDGVSTSAAILTTFTVTVISVFPEYLFIANVYRMVPSLSRPEPNADRDASHLASANEDRPASPHRTALIKTLKNIIPLSYVPFYVSHPAFIPSLSLAVLYLTVLSFSGQMVTFLLSVGYSSGQIGIARTVSTLFELSATIISPLLIQRIGTIRAGIWCLSWQMIWLTAGVSWFVTDWARSGSSNLLAVSGLVGGVIVSRIGLWGYDLAAQNIIQDEVEDRHRGAFSTAEASAQNLFELLSYASTIIFSRPDQFQWPIIISVSAVYTAGGLYTAYVRHQRGHLFHPPPCLDCKTEEP